MWDEIQIMMKDNNLESTFKNKADSLTSEVRPKLWDKLEKRMDDHYESTFAAPPVISIDWLRYAAAFILLIGAGFMLKQVSQNNSVATRFVMEEISTHVEADQKYKEMVEFSQKYYRTLINPGAKQKL